MTTKNKKDVLEEIKTRFSESDSVILVDYRGLSVKLVSELRKSLREADASMTVYKNTLTELAIRELALPSLDEYLEGPTAFVFISGDPVAPAKVISTFAEKNTALEIKGALVGNSVLGNERVEALAKLPSREELLAKLLGTLQNPMRGFVTVAAGPARGLVTALQAVADQKDAA